MPADLRIGVDVLMLDRFRRIGRHHRFRRMLFTEAELAQLPGSSSERADEYLAGRFSAKEAVGKVLGTGYMSGVAWRDVEVTRDGRGAPMVTLRAGARDAAEALGLGTISVSISHQGPLVVAVAAGGSA